MKKQKSKTNKGITLIALVITIVVLLILAMVSINLIMNGGIIAHAENATSKYSEEQEKEKIALAFSAYKMEKYSNPNATLSVEGATVTGSEEAGWKVVFNETSSTYKVDKEGNITYVEPGKEENGEEIEISSQKDITMVSYLYNTMHNPNQPEIVPVHGYADDEDNNKISDVNSELPAFLESSKFDIPVSFFTATIPTSGNISAIITHYDGTEEEITFTTTDNKKWTYEKEESPLLGQENIFISIRPYAKYNYKINVEAEDCYENSTDYHYIYMSMNTAVPFEKIRIFGKTIEFPVKCQAMFANMDMTTGEIDPIYDNIDNVSKITINFTDSPKVEYSKENIFNAETYMGNGFYYSSQNIPILYTNGALIINMPEYSFKTQITSIIIEENGVATKYNVNNSTEILNISAWN